ncbi:MAG: 30S ribosome-binding factor RbfA [Planctomycetota bacterium]|jgi:ribosome-binding factor A|nr:30S ribosome-binding factor RbfA [Planctomycetota bacterium]
MPSRRQERVGKRVIQELVDAFRQLKNADLGFLTITGCRVSPDFRSARVKVSVWGGDEDRRRVMELLEQNAPRLRWLIGRPLGLKASPEIFFELDSSPETAERISRLIREARLTDVNPNLPPAEAVAPVPIRPPGKIDRFEEARRRVEEDIAGIGEFADPEDDPAWRPLDLDALPGSGEDPDE